jgi:hypothetical protein
VSSWVEGMGSRPKCNQVQLRHDALIGCRHQRCGKQQGPDQPKTKLSTRLGVSRNATWIIIHCTGYQTRAEAVNEFLRVHLCHVIASRSLSVTQCYSVLLNIRCYLPIRRSARGCYCVQLHRMPKVRCSLGLRLCRSRHQNAG